MCSVVILIVPSYRTNKTMSIINGSNRLQIYGNRVILRKKKRGILMIYLDYAASAPPYPQVAERVAQVMTEFFGNPGAIHGPGNQSRRILQESRRTVARLLGVREQELFFTSGGTEANNWAVKLGLPGKKHIIASAIEHKSVLEPLRQLEKQGYSVTYVAPDKTGRISVAAVEKAVNADTGLICVQAVNNETGVIQDVDGLAALAKRRGIPYFCDAVQSFGHIRQDLSKAGIVSLSAHKLGGPSGIGCLGVRYPYFSAPMIYGGGQEQGRRSGTENVPGAAGFALAAELAAAEPEETLRELRDILERKLKNIAPNLVINGADAPRHPAILNCRFPGMTGEEMAARLDLKGICVSPGAACAARERNPSHVLLAMGQTERQAMEAVRFSLGRLTTVDEITATAQAVAEILNREQSLKASTV